MYDLHNAKPIKPGTIAVLPRAGIKKPWRKQGGGRKEYARRREAMRSYSKKRNILSSPSQRRETLRGKEDNEH